MTWGNIIHVSELKEVPKEECFAILKEGRKYNEPYDQHDTGSYSSIIEMEVVKGGEKELLEEIERLEKNNEGYSQKEYKVVRIIPVEVNVKRSINIGIKK